jgi:hypothetical protein
MNTSPHILAQKPTCATNPYGGSPMPHLCANCATSNLGVMTATKCCGWVWARTATLAAVGCVVFALGLLVYLTDRDASKVALLPDVAILAGRHVFGALGYWLPSFVHVFAFSLFTGAALPERSVPRYGACIGWFAVNLVFEVGQHPTVSARLAKVLQGDLSGMPLAQRLARYFVHGTFDSGDIFAALMGALGAGAVLRLMHRGQEETHGQ